MPTSAQTISEATPLLPDIAAETAIERLAQRRGINVTQEQRDRLVANLVTRAENEFQTNADFKKKLCDKTCRDWLYAFFEHIIKSERLLPAVPTNLTEY